MILRKEEFMTLSFLLNSARGSCTIGVDYAAGCFLSKVLKSTTVYNTMKILKMAESKLSKTLEEQLETIEELNRKYDVPVIVWVPSLNDSVDKELRAYFEKNNIRHTSRDGSIGSPFGNFEGVCLKLYPSQINDIAKLEIVKRIDSQLEYRLLSGPY